ncbi:hypothetical protein M011DRAFT_489569 [Sporormia fimetaria CBS 119925]|uniref:Uncharacterized protein n=1 Tax=Sporormia fimetaria CBS 119925 TaxID=1340428 RepID=A0A6A6UZD8_9PLEO|nr:hypothetical protein M011DRAFT_489569 [Sporormia fimetaria CBS 119925]
MVQTNPTSNPPDSINSSPTLHHLPTLPPYKTAKTILIDQSPSLDPLIHHALRDDKHILIQTPSLKDGFIFLSPHLVNGRQISLSQMQDRNITVDVVILSSDQVTTNGIQDSEAYKTAFYSWMVLADRGILTSTTPVISILQNPEVVQDTSAASLPTQFLPDEIIAGLGHLSSDIITTPQGITHIPEASKPTLSDNWMDMLPEETNDIEVIQELRGMKIAERVMADSGIFATQTTKQKEEVPPEEQFGRELAEKIMSGFRT